LLLRGLQVVSESRRVTIGLKVQPVRPKSGLGFGGGRTFPHRNAASHAASNLQPDSSNLQHATSNWQLVATATAAVAAT